MNTPPNKKNHDLTPIEGNYQLKALVSGHPLQQAWHQSRLNHLTKNLNFQENEVVADIGCGSAITLKTIASKISRGIGIDTNQKALDFCNIYYQHKKNLHFQFGTLEKTNINPHSLDKIICTEVIEHVYEEQVRSALLHWKDILKKKGEIYLTTPNYQSIWPVLEWILDRTRLIPQMAEEQHVSKWTISKLLKILRDTGYSDIEVGSFNILSPIGTAMKSENLSKKITLLEKNVLPRFGLLLYAKAKAL